MRVVIVADPTITTHVVEVEAVGNFGRFRFMEDVAVSAENRKVMRRAVSVVWLRAEVATLAAGAKPLVDSLAAGGATVTVTSGKRVFVRGNFTIENGAVVVRNAGSAPADSGVTIAPILGTKASRPVISPRTSQGLGRVRDGAIRQASRYPGRSKRRLICHRA